MFCHSCSCYSLNTLQAPVKWTHATYLSIVADHVHSFVEAVFADSCGFSQQDNALCHKAKMIKEWFEEHNSGMR